MLNILILFHCSLHTLHGVEITVVTPVTCREVPKCFQVLEQKALAGENLLV